MIRAIRTIVFLLLASLLLTLESAGADQVSRPRILGISHMALFVGDLAKARAFYEDCVFKQGDWEGVENLVSIMGLNSQSIPVAALQRLKEHFIAGWVGYPLIGTKEQVVEGLAELERAGFDGIVLSWPRYVAGMQQFKAETFPLVQQAGLR